MLLVERALVMTAVGWRGSIFDMPLLLTSSFKRVCSCDVVWQAAEDPACLAAGIYPSRRETRHIFGCSVSSSNGFQILLTEHGRCRLDGSGVVAAMINCLAESCLLFGKLAIIIIVIITIVFLLLTASAALGAAASATAAALSEEYSQRSLHTQPKPRQSMSEPFRSHRPTGACVGSEFGHCGQAAEWLNPSSWGWGEGQA